MSEEDIPYTVAVAVLTYRRPEDLASALPGLLAQLDKISCETTLLVIDNDPQGTARESVAGFNSPLIRYIHEPKPGIAAGRNRALAESENYDLLVFIDDDETPSEDWLEQLVMSQRSSGAAAVVGPVISRYAQPPEPWIQQGEFFDRRRLPTGTRLEVAATNNLLLDMRQIRDLNLGFDERFGLSGGSDTLFTRKLARMGNLMIWCDEAVVYDHVPSSRLTRSWVLKRAVRSGNSSVRVNLELSKGLVRRTLSRAEGVMQGASRVLAGSVRFAAGVAAKSMAHRAQGLRTAARGAGMISAAFGYVYSEYKRKS